MSQSTNFPEPLNAADPMRWDGEAELPERRTNMDITLKHQFEATIMHGMFSLMELMGVDRASAFMGGLLRTLGPLLRPVHKRGLNNLRLVFPENSDDENEAILKKVWENLGRTVGEYPHLECFRAFEDGGRVEVEGEDILRSLIEQERPVIFVTSHMANWEVIGTVLYRAGVKFAIVYRAANNPIVDERIIDLRAGVMTRHQAPKGKRGGRALINFLNSGLSLCMLVDQKLNDGIRVPFMGHDAMTPSAAARMALKYDAPVVPIGLRRLDGASFRVSFHDPLVFSATGDTHRDAESLTAQINDVLGEIIKANPGQWLWLHRRWPRDVMKDAGLE